MLTIIPLVTHKARATGNLTIKGIPTTALHCTIRSFVLKNSAYISERCPHKVNFLISNTKPKLDFFGGKVRFKGMNNALVTLCALHTMKHIEKYKSDLEHRLWKANEHAYDYKGEVLSERNRKIRYTKTQNELKKIDSLISLVYRYMKSDKNIAADLLEV